ncbi:MAG: glycosyltransferase [Pigmentiphaga sp.]|nr:glycosyltransferase [Pigmentiphaga sp.]
MRDAPHPRHEAPPAAPVPGRVSVIMPCFNAAATLDQAVRSVRDQNYGNWELWIVDDASTDESRAIASRHARDDARIRLLSNRHRKGAAGARNTGIQAAEGEFIAFLDADDYWLPAKLGRQVAAMQAEQAVFSATSYQRIDARGQPLGRFSIQPRIRYRDLLYSNTIGCLTAMYNQGRIGKVLMPEDYHHEDYLTWLDILRRHGPALGIPEALAVYRRHKHSLSGSKTRAARWQWRIYREALQLPWWQAAYLFCHYAWRGVRKHHRSRP